MKIDVKVLSLICGISLVAVCGPVRGAADSAVAPGQGTTSEAPASEASPTTEKKASARHQRKTYLNAQRNARREARKQAAAQNPAAAMPSAGPVTDLAVAFRTDPRLTRSLYMGDRWFSAPSFTTVQDVERINVDVRVVGRDHRGVETPVNPEWLPADPKMVTVSPARGNVVTITVHKAGESTLRVVQSPPARAAGGQAEPAIVKEFAIRAWNQGPAIQAEITQKDATKAVSPKPTASQGASAVAMAVSADGTIDRAAAQSDAKR